MSGTEVAQDLDGIAPTHGLGQNVGLEQLKAGGTVGWEAPMLAGGDADSRWRVSMGSAQPVGSSARARAEGRWEIGEAVSHNVSAGCSSWQMVSKRAARSE